MPEHTNTIGGIKEVESLTVYVNGKEIKSKRRNLEDVGDFASFCKNVDEIIAALAAPTLSWYLDFVPEYVPPKQWSITQPMPKNMGTFVVGVNNPVGFVKYLETQEQPLNILCALINNACKDRALETLYFEITRELAPYDTGESAIYY